MKTVEGFRGGRGKLLRTATETHYRAMYFAFRDRKAKKRTYRALWITRITAALETYDINYSQFMGGLNKAKIDVNRKMLAEMAIYDPKGFEKYIDLARKNVPAHLLRKA